MADISTKQKKFMQAYQLCHEPFIRYCSALAYGKMDTEDLVQDVLLTAYHHFDKIEKKGQLLHYLIRAARNRSISYWRKSKFQTQWLDQHTEQLQAKGLSPELSLDIQFLYRCLDRLPTEQRDAIVLFEISGFSMKEIAVIQKSTVGAIKTKVSRGRKKLKQLMTDQPYASASSSASLSQMLETLKTIAL